MDENIAAIQPRVVDEFVAPWKVSGYVLSAVVGDGYAHVLWALGLEMCIEIRRYQFQVKH